jgi:hypothetical protein
MITTSKIEQAKQYSKAEFLKQSTTEESKRKENLTYFTAFRRTYNVTPQDEARIVEKITRSPTIEAWKELTRLWIDNTRTVPDALKKLMLEEVRTATEESKYYVHSRLIEIHLENSITARDFKVVKNEWVRNSEQHYYVLVNEAVERPRHTLSKEDWWFINEVQLKIWYESVGIRIEESSVEHLEEKEVPPPPIYV